jgi:N6-L-threonylcarbamoyladenine synthase
VKAVTVKLARALDREDAAYKSIMVGGGVAANTRLRRELASLANERGLVLCVPEMRFCVDNAAMIAGLGAELLRAGRISGLDLRAVPTTAA